MLHTGLSAGLRWESAHKLAAHMKLWNVQCHCCTKNVTNVWLPKMTSNWITLKADQDGVINPILLHTCTNSVK